MRMLVNALSILLLLVAGMVTGESAEPSTEKKLRDVIQQSQQQTGAETVAVAFLDLRTGQRILINERARLHAASTMKIPVMMEVFRLAGRGELSLTEPVTVINHFSSIFDGTPFSLTPGSDSDQEIYQQVGRQMTVLQLVERMITISSNLATNILIERVRPENVRKLTRRLGARDIDVRRGVEDNKAFQAGLNNTTTALDLMLLLADIARWRKLPKVDYDLMIEILAKQKYNDAIPAGLPPGLVVAHKTGEITRHHHDAAIVYQGGWSANSGNLQNPYILVILTRGVVDRTVSSQLIAKLASIIHQDLATPARGRHASDKSAH